MLSYFFNRFLLCFLIAFSPITFALNVGDVAPDFSLNKLSTQKNAASQTISLSDYKGKVVYLDFWASWCGPCRKAFPFMDELQKEYEKEGLVVLAVNQDTKPSLAINFLKKNKSNLTSLFDKNGQVSSAYELRGMPSSFLIDKKGVIHSSHVGFNDSKIKKIREEVKRLLQHN